MLTIEVVGRPSPELLEKIEQAIAVLVNVLGKDYEQTNISYTPESCSSEKYLIIRDTSIPWTNKMADMERINKIAKIIFQGTQTLITAETINPLLTPMV